MKEFTCGAVVPGCDTRIEGQTEEEILEQVAVHAREAHGMDHVPPEVVEEVRSRIQDV